MGAGILPIANKDGEIYIMLGRERKQKDFRDSHKWSDFGGGQMKGESVEDCAVREGFEETMGMFGGPCKLRKMMEECIFKLETEGYTSYVIEVEYDEKKEKYFNEIFKCISKKHKNLIKEKNGFFEKDKVKWVKLKNYKNLVIREWYEPILERLCKELLGE